MTTIKSMFRIFSETTESYYPTAMVPPRYSIKIYLVNAYGYRALASTKIIDV